MMFNITKKIISYEYVIIALLSLLLLLKGQYSFADDHLNNAIPLGCLSDLNNDGQDDIALLVNIKGINKLMVLLNTNSKYQVFSLDSLAEDIPVKLYCVDGSEIRETRTGSSLGRLYKTMGAYLELVFPESSSVAFFWDGLQFREVWTSD